MRPNPKRAIYLSGIFIILIIISINSNNNTNLDQNVPIEEKNENEIKNSPRSSNYWILSPIMIDGSATGVGAQNWSWAVSQDWCRGSGTTLDPYIIENLTINGQNITNCIEIRNSVDFFVIKNCTLYNSTFGGWSAALKLVNVSNGLLIENNCSNNHDIGIYLENSHSNTVVKNYIYNNSMLGLHLQLSENNSLSENTIIKQGRWGIYLEKDSNNNTVFKNYVSNCSWDGVVLAGQDISCNLNNFSENIITNNIGYNIYFAHSDDNIFSDNIISNAGLTGLFIDADSDRNVVFRNQFLENDRHGYDDGIDNHWNNSIIGNYWDNYTSIDQNDDGIGDNSYDYIAGLSSSRDYYPIWDDGHNGSIISINDDANNNWEWAKSRVWCSGLGTFDNPYVIEDLTIDGQGAQYCIQIKNSSAYFRIENCTVHSSGQGTYNGGIKLNNSINGVLIDNNCSFNNRTGIILIESCNISITENLIRNNLYNGIVLKNNSTLNSISRNTIRNNTWRGIDLMDNSDNNTILENTLSSQYINIYIHRFCDNNTIHKNKANSSSYGITVSENSTFNLISQNNSSLNMYGIHFAWNCTNNHIERNIIKNTYFGIDFFYNCSYNTGTNNLISDSKYYGINISGPDCKFNHFYYNFLESNGVNANDNGSNTTWNSTTFGNYWSDYTGVDNNYDGIGDSQYDIQGNAGGIDNLPLWSYAPPIHINGAATGLGAHNWTWAKNHYWCTGSGTNLDPYVIKCLNINGKNISDCIFIENSNEYFRIENCSLVNSNVLDYNAGVKLKYANNGKLINNTCSFNNDIGIYIYYSENITISNNTIFHNTYTGIFLQACENITISSNRINNTNLYNGIRLYNCDYINVTNNLVINSGECGIRVSNGKYNRIINNSIYNQTQHGIHLRDNSDYNIIFNNTVFNNTLNGIYLYNGCDKNIISNNTMKYNINSGIKLESECKENNLSKNILIENQFGIYFYNNCDNNSLFENEAYNNSEIGIYIGLGDFNNLSRNKLINNINGMQIHGIQNIVSSNVISNNKINGIRVVVASNNYFHKNNITYNGGQGIIIETHCYNNTILENFIENNNEGIYLYGYYGPVNKNNITRNIINNHMNGAAILLKNQCNNNSIINNNITDNYYGIYIHYEGICMNNTISSNLMYGCSMEVTSSLEALASTKVDKMNLVNGKKLYYYINETGLNSNNFTNPGQIILINCNNSLIENYKISNCTNCISLCFGYNNTVINNTLTDSHRAAIKLINSKNNTIINNTASNLGYGVFLIGGDSDFNNITKNIVDRTYIAYYIEGDFNNITNNLAFNNTYGIECYFADNNTISDNTIYNTQKGVPLYLYISHSNSFIGNIVYDNEDYGIYVCLSDYNVIRDNIAYNNSHGIHIRDGCFNLVYNNTADSNLMNGLYIENYNTGSNNNTIINNIIKNNYNHGIFISECNNNKISNNTIFLNQLNGITLYNSSNNFIINNTETINNNDYCGIYLEISDYNSIINNIINNNYYGLLLNQSNFNNITFNLLKYNEIGIYEINCSGNYFYKNTIIEEVEEQPSDDDDDKKSKEDYVMVIIIIIIIGISVAATAIIITRVKKNKARPVLERKKLKTPTKESKSIESKPKPAKDFPLEQGTKPTDQEILEDAKTKREVKVEDQREVICIVHRGRIYGNIFLCPHCKTFYCDLCAKVLKLKGEKCWSCGNEIDIEITEVDKSKLLEKRAIELVDELINEAPLINVFLEPKKYIDNLPEVRDLIVSILSKEELDKIDLLNLSIDEKKTFIKELLTLELDERKDLIDEMLKSKG